MHDLAPRKWLARIIQKGEDFKKEMRNKVRMSKSWICEEHGYNTHPSECPGCSSGRIVELEQQVKDLRIVYIVLASHKWEGISICGVCDEKPSQEFAETLVREYSRYPEDEFRICVKTIIVDYPVMKVERNENSEKTD